MDQVPHRFFFDGSCGEYFCGLVSSVFKVFMRPIGGPIAVAALVLEGLGVAEGCEILVARV